MNKQNLKNLELIKKINKDFLINQKSDIFICLILLLIVSLTTAIYPFLIQKVFDNFTVNEFSWFFLVYFTYFLTPILNTHVNDFVKKM